MTSVGAFLELLAVPTLVTMFISGLWHGAGYQFILWGLLHGTYLSINHAWRFLGPKRWLDKETYERIMRPTGFTITFLSVAVTMVIFRSDNLGAATKLLQGMAGLNGMGLPQAIHGQLGPLMGLLQPFVFVSAEISATELVTSIGWLVALLLIALLLPNTLRMLARYAPALGVQSEPVAALSLSRALDWTPSSPWAVGMSAMVVAAIMCLGGKSEFLYWQF